MPSFVVILDVMLSDKKGCPKVGEAYLTDSLIVSSEIKRRFLLADLLVHEQRQK
jgi:hypothetical protein